MKLKLRKLSDDLGIDKENYLLQNLLKKEPKKKKKSSPCLSERELTSNKLDPVNVPKRYDSIETKLSEGESVELPTFGNWKEKINVSDENNRLEMYEKMRVKEIYTTSKQNKDDLNFPRKIKPIFPVNNKIVNRFQLSSHQSQRQNKNILYSHQKQKKSFKTLEIQEKNKHQKKIFSELYLKQKSEYQKIFKKYGINEKVDDSQFQIFLALG